MRQHPGPHTRAPAATLAVCCPEIQLWKILVATSRQFLEPTQLKSRRRNPIRLRHRPISLELLCTAQLATPSVPARIMASLTYYQMSQEATAAIRDCSATSMSRHKSAQMEDPWPISTATLFRILRETRAFQDLIV